LFFKVIVSKNILLNRQKEVNIGELPFLVDESGQGVGERGEILSIL
jgi:hypothetical protein